MLTPSQRGTLVSELRKSRCNMLGGQGARWGAVSVETESLVSGAGEVSQSDPFLSVGVKAIKS